MVLTVVQSFELIKLILGPRRAMTCDEVPSVIPPHGDGGELLGRAKCRRIHLEGTWSQQLCFTSVPENSVENKPFARGQTTS